MQNKQSRLLIWVTSDCNLACPLCSQEYTKKAFPGYHMSFLEILQVTRSLKNRGIRFDVIELTGGEPSLWSNLKVGVQLFSEVCDVVTMVTNGNEPDKVLRLGLPYIIVSSSQASPEQLAEYKKAKGIKIAYNTHEHKPLPVKRVNDPLPAQCCVRKDCFGKEQTSLLYLAGTVYSCCNAFAISEKTGLSDSIACDFESNFFYLQEKDYNNPICAYCICNSKVWNQIGDQI